MTASSSDAIHTLENKNGMRLALTAYGGKVISLWAPDKNGVMADVMLGFDSVAGYRTGNPYFGAIIGRYANRIKAGKFSLEGKDYQLVINNGVNALHGGPKGFHQVMWNVVQLEKQKVVLRYNSPHLEENFPGILNVVVTYLLTDDNEWVVEYEATTDRDTILNLTHHAFFNLKGEGEGDILDHWLEINSDQFCPVDDTLIPTGELRAVAGTPFDFRTRALMGSRIQQQEEQLQRGNGYDHNWVLNKSSNELSLAARVSENESGRVMEVYTTEPGLQFYSGNFLDGSDVGKGGKRYGHRSAFCLETQHFPDSPNQPHFPTTILKPGEVYRQKTVYRFLTSTSLISP